MRERGTLKHFAELVPDARLAVTVELGLLRNFEVANEPLGE